MGFEIGTHHLANGSVGGEDVAALVRYPVDEEFCPLALNASVNEYEITITFGVLLQPGILLPEFRFDEGGLL